VELIKIMNINTLYTVQRINKEDVLYGNTHGSFDGESTVCGYVCNENWYITDNTFSGEIKCPKCIKILKDTEDPLNIKSLKEK